MGITYTLDARCSDILKMIVYAGDYINIGTITDRFGISRRSAYYDIEKINDWLRDNGLAELERDRTKGIRISSGQAAEIQAVLFHKEDKIQRVLSPLEREHLIICILCLRETPLYVENLMQFCDVSRNTTVNDLKIVAAFLKKNKLKLSYSIKTGYRILGEPVRKRAFFFLYCPQFLNYITESFFTKQQFKLMQDCHLRLKEIEHELHTEYVIGILPTLACFIASILSGGSFTQDRISFSDIDVREIRDSREYDLTCRHFEELKDDEQIYVALHLLGSRIQTEQIQLEEDEKEAQAIAAMLVNSFEEVSAIRYVDQKELIKALTAHLRTSLYRYRYGIQLGNSMLENIRSEYKELFALTKAAFLRISDDIGMHVPDSEIAYLTLHFGAFMYNEDISSRPYRIMIICPNGIGTSNMIKTEIRRLVPKATEVKNIPLSRYAPDNDYDVIISTVPIENESRLVVVNPILTDQDRVSILHRCINTEPSARIQINAIMQIARKYISADNIPDFETEIAGCFGAMKVQEVPKTDFGAGLLQYLQISHIQIVTKETAWVEALIYSLRPLLVNDSITQDYVDAIVEEQTQNHHYMMLTDGLVLAHSKSEHGVKKLDAAITVFSEPVIWENEKPVRIVIALAAEDQTRHIHILNDILDIFSKKKNLEKISVLHSPLEVYSCLAKQLEH